MNVLIASDSAASRTHLGMFVNRRGHQHVLAHSGQEAWDLLQDNDCVDLVIIDWSLPEPDGLAVIDLARQAGDERRFYILLGRGEDDKRVLQAIKSGADHLLVKPVHPHELEAALVVAERFQRLQDRLKEQQAQIDSMSGRLDDLARTDVLTHLGNSRRLQEDLQAVHARVHRYGHSYAVGMCDVDHLRDYNERFGYHAGDHVLRKVATTIASQCRSGDMAYRYAGEEFVVVLPEQTAEKAAIGVERMRRAVEELAIPHPGSECGVVTISAGVAGCPPGAKVVEPPLPEADEAMYWAKEQGRNRTLLYDHDLGKVLTPA